MRKGIETIEIEDNYQADEQRVQLANRISKLTSLVMLTSGAVSIGDAFLDYIPDYSALTSAYLGTTLMLCGSMMAIANSKLNQRTENEQS